jgi:hypothetical protein
MKLITLILSLMVAVCAQAGMVRVVSVDGARTITIEQEGRREQIQLAGLQILDEPRATDLLRWTIGTSWVLVEKHPGGGHLVFRSPDALFVNRELVLRGYARATAFGIEAAPNLNVTYLGQLDPPFIAPRSATAPSPRTRAPRRSPKPAAPARKRAKR